MGSLSNPVVQEEKLLIVNIDLSLTVFVVLRLVTDRQTHEIGLAKGGTTMH